MLRDVVPVANGYCMVRVILDDTIYHVYSNISQSGIGTFLSL